MGYYTQYKLTMKPHREEIWDFIKEDRQLRSPLYANAECKWYDHEQDMLLLSTKFPEITFTLHGEGEGNDDIWEKHFRNGKMQECRAVIVIFPLDETKWK